MILLDLSSLPYFILGRTSHQLVQPKKKERELMKMYKGIEQKHGILTQISYCIVEYFSSSLTYHHNNGDFIIKKTIIGS